jgi:hypothetical protein
MRSMRFALDKTAETNIQTTNEEVLSIVAVADVDGAAWTLDSSFDVLHFILF